ncbi:MAG: UDP-N-acetylmuramate--L-alanine ligase [Anaerolinea sp.]|nr:UDP-N-acetylmuramate--L-alanine ligase [Anaerolinea sp.]
MYQQVHIVGIGGAGMSAIARVLLGRGIRVSGSDRSLNPVTAALESLGAVIYQGHAAAQIEGAEALLISSAIKDDNPEVVAARSAGVPILKRREALPLVMGDKTQIAVAGTHGKTTTTALITHLLREAGRDPSYIVGSVMGNTGDNARAGSGDAFVIEADEYDTMFWGLTPTIALITNLEHDHPDMFPTMTDMIHAFEGFIERIPEYDGVLITCADSPEALALAQKRRASGQPTLTYSLEGKGNWNLVETSEGVLISGMENGQEIEALIHAALPPSLAGRHNLQNALGAVAAVVAYGIPLQTALTGLGTFRGTERRMQVLGTFREAVLISDYGHHPTAIHATLEALRRLYPQSKIWAVWQPHTFSRTRELGGAFAHAFGDADHVLITDIYPARERFQPGDPDGANMAAQTQAAGHPDARHSGDLSQTAALLQTEVGPGEVVILFSAGDAPHIWDLLQGQ